MRNRRLISATLAPMVVGLATGVSYAALGGAGGSGIGRPKITAGPAKLTNQAAAEFGYRSKTAVDFLCSLDGGAFSACGSGTAGSVTYAGPLADGAHTFRVEAQLGPSTSKPAKRTWTIDTIPPPPPAFTETPPDPTTESKARFKYRDAESGVSLECALDGEAYAPCGHSRHYRDLPAGTHVFCVRGWDKAGNASPAACFSWAITGGGAGFSISGSPPTGELLYPGGAAVPVDLVFTNPNATPITVESVTVSVTGTSSPGCEAANFSVTRQLNATPTVPGGSTVSLEDLGVARPDWPQLQMMDAGNQDDCQNATVNLAYSGTASG